MSNAVGVKDKVLYNVTGRTLTYEAPEGRPSADGTVTFYDPRYARDDTAHNPIGTAGTATRLSVNTTITGAAGPTQSNPRSIPVVPPAALLIGHFVWITNASSQTERCEIVAIGTATVTVADDLIYEHATGATFVSALMTSSAISSTFLTSTANLGEDYEAVWVYTVAGTQYTKRTRWDLVRELVDWSVPEARLLERFPDAKRFPFSRQGTFAPQLRAAQRDVDILVISARLDPDKLRGNEVLAYLVELRALAILAEAGAKPNGVELEAAVTRWRAQYEQVANAILNGTIKLPYDTDEDDVISDDDRKVTSIDLIR